MVTLLAQLRTMSRILAVLLCGVSLILSQQWPNKEGPHHAEDRDQWFYSQGTFPIGSIPPGARRDAILKIQRNDAVVRARRQAARSVTPPNKMSPNEAFAITTDSSKWT